MLWPLSAAKTWSLLDPAFLMFSWNGLRGKVDAESIFQLDELRGQTKKSRDILSYTHAMILLFSSKVLWVHCAGLPACTIE
jgi:hypothetical protein